MTFVIVLCDVTHNPQLNTFFHYFLFSYKQMSAKPIFSVFCRVIQFLGSYSHLLVCIPLILVSEFLSRITPIKSFIFQCPRLCPLFELTLIRLCVSRCPDCGNLCEAFPVTDLDSLKLYSSQGCTLISGDLHITNLPSSVTEDNLFDHLSNVRFLRGSLIVHDNHFLSSLAFARKVVVVTDVSLSNNPNLIDARMPSLQRFLGHFEAKGCHRLCPARYTVVGPSPSDDGCPSLLRLGFLSILGPNELSVDYACSIVSNAFRFFSNGAVCQKFGSLLLLLVVSCC
jgi:hypothetical protein